MPLIPKPRVADREGFPLIQVPIERRQACGSPVRIRLGSKWVPGIFIGYRWRKAGARAHRAELRAMGVFKLPKSVWIADGACVSYRRKRTKAGYDRGQRIIVGMRGFS
ncbi:hypothetical protein FPV67DRAFT_1446336 [Lyophyllum atratum]|nr:hypothetical protein FPV67DRAFT_1446336 [Lyophyllum atratum]